MLLYNKFTLQRVERKKSFRKREKKNDNHYHNQSDQKKWTAEEQWTVAVVCQVILRRRRRYYRGSAGVSELDDADVGDGDDHGEHIGDVESRREVYSVQYLRSYR